jgi:hypothetical protein
MNQLEAEDIATKIFHRLRESKFKIGVNEYIAALDAIRGGMGTLSRVGISQRGACNGKIPI